MKKIIKIILLFICLGVFILSAYQIYTYIKEEKENKEYNQELIEKVLIEKTNHEQEENILPISVDFTILQNENTDIIGWLYSENTPINYPVVQGKDNTYYIDKLPNGKENAGGSIFMDYRNKPTLENGNTILYGHNMKNDTMFGTIQEYKNQEYYEKHKTMYYFTPEKNFTITIFAGFTVSTNSKIYDLGVIDEKLITQWKEQSDFSSNVQVNPQDKIITLSTCAYEYEGARYIIMGVVHEIL